MLELPPTWQGPRYAKLFPFWYKVHRLLYSTLSVSQTGSRVWSQFNCLGTHSCWLHSNFPKLVKQTCFFGMHLHKVIIISNHIIGFFFFKSQNIQESIFSEIFSSALEPTMVQSYRKYK